MFKNLIKLCKILSIKDDTAFQTAVASFFGKTQDIKMLHQYGISFNPPKNSIGVMFSQSGNEDSLWAIADLPNGRFKDLKEGELRVGNYLTGDSVYFKADGTMEIQSSSQVDITAPIVNVTGDVVVSGTVTAANFISSGISVDFNTHVHSDPQGGLTGVPQ